MGRREGRELAIGGGIIAIFILGLVALFVVTRFYVSVPAGHVAVASLFGKVQKEPYPEGLHIPVNPLYAWHLFDIRQKTHLEKANVPSQDQLQTSVDVSVQYRLIAGRASDIYRETGSIRQVLDVHLVPKLRSVLREQGKTIKRAEDFFLDTTQEKLQVALLQQLSEYLAPKGIEVQAVLIRDIMLPQFITKAIEAKKEREQAVERQKAELERFKKEQEQKVAAAQAEKKAAEAEAEKIQLLADAKAYEINKISEAIAGNPAYLKLESLKTLKGMAGDPAAKIYFMDSNSPNPLPLLHIGDDKK